MTVNRKPIAQAQDENVDVSALINKGGQVACEEANDVSKVRRLQLRMDMNLITKIDAARKSRAVRPSRHMWLLEAVHDKLEKERNQG